MPDLQTLLAAEAARQEPPARPPFDALLRRHRNRTRRRRGLGGLAAAAVLAAGAVLPGVLGAGPSPRTPGGPSPQPVQVTGQLVEIGGPPPGGPRGVPGTVRFAGGDRPVSVDTDADGHFAVALPPGTYTVTGTSPAYGDGHYTCQADGPLAVPGSPIPRLGPVDVTVACQMP
jgi:hypothetical protein